MLIPLDQIIAYSFTIISVTLFFVEKRRNVKKPIFMALQGLLKSTHVKFQCHNAHFGILAKDRKETERKVTIDEYMLYAQMVQSDFESQVQQVLGIMESLEVKGKVIDSEHFTGHKAELKEFEKKLNKQEDKKT